MTTARDQLNASLDDRQAPWFSVGQVAELAQVAPWFLRRLDKLDVVSPSRSEGDQRRYSRDQIEQIVDARVLMDEGVSVAGVRRVFALQARIAELEAEVVDLQEQLARWPHPTPASSMALTARRQEGES